MPPTPEQPRKRSLSFYLVLILLVGPLWASVPLSWLFVIFSLRTGRIWSYGWQGKLCFLVSLVEVFFSVYYYSLSKIIADTTSPRFKTSIGETQAALGRVLQTGLSNLPEEGLNEDEETLDRPASRFEAIVQLLPDDPRAVDFREILRSWFGRSPWSHIRLQEIKQWIYWSLFNTHMPPAEKMPEGHSEALDEILDLLQKRVGGPITPGSAPEIAPMRLTLDPVVVHWRPLMWYAAVAIINKIFKIRFKMQYSVRFISHDGVQYLLRIPKHWDPVKGLRPIVFIHGLGLGLFQYHPIIINLLDTFVNQPLLVPIQPHISQDIFHPRFLKPASRHETARKLGNLLRKLGWVPIKEYDSEDSEADREAIRTNTKKREVKGVTLLSHSNGSYTHAWMLKNHPEMIQRSCFVDPVTFCSWEGDACYNFLYRPCKTGMEVLMKYFVASELGVANLMHRHFEWTSNALWFEEIPNARDPSKASFFLGGDDSIVNAGRVKKYLRSHGVRKGLWFDPHGHHGQALEVGGGGHREIIQWLKQPL